MQLIRFWILDSGKTRKQHFGFRNSDFGFKKEDVTLNLFQGLNLFNQRNERNQKNQKTRDAEPSSA